MLIREVELQFLIVHNFDLNRKNLEIIRSGEMSSNRRLISTNVLIDICKLSH